MSEQLYALLIWLGCLSVFAFLLFGADKYKAKRGRWRIPEAALLSCALFGGGVGALLGMELFRHKTRKPLFSVVIPLSALFQLGLLLWVWLK
ncbi:MAG: DUF1294 domain-containing protein [Oscillospiraceae bacterium]|nr:DUF1294 domain-containing protein [Oscillospiraceae bacterium]